MGFAGAPFTVGTYMVGGDGSYDGDRLKRLAHENGSCFHQLMEKITAATVDYLTAQVEAGVDAVQLFDTWAGTLSSEDYQTMALPYAREILGSIRALGLPTLLYIKGGGHLLEQMMIAGPEVISLDWRVGLSEARARTQGKVALQGNLDPTVLYSPVPKINEAVSKMIADWGRGPGYIMNLGHGILEDIPVHHAHAFVEAAKKYGPSTL